MRPGHRYSPVEWANHVAIRRRRTFAKLGQAKISWINESPYPDHIGRLGSSAHSEALQAMVDIAHKSRDRNEFTRKFSAWFERYPKPGQPAKSRSH